MPRQKHRIEWALFCEKTERDGLGFLHITKVQGVVPFLDSETLGIPMCLVFAVRGAPKSKPMVHVTIVRPGGDRVANAIPIDLGPSGGIEVTATMGPLLINEVGEIRAEFRFDGDVAPCHVATLRVVEQPFSVLPAQSTPPSKH